VGDEDHAISFYDLRRGTPVVSADGRQIGTVHEALNNDREHIFDGIVIDTETGRRFVDAPEVARLTHAAVTLTITADQAAELPERGGALSRIRRRLSGGAGTG
jgi:hypothetical protein